MSTDHPETPDEIMASLRKRDAALQAYAVMTKSVAGDDGGWLGAAMGAVAETLVKERKRVAEEHAKMRAEFQAELAKLRIELLESQLAEARGIKRPLRVVSPVQSEQLIG